MGRHKGYSTCWTRANRQEILRDLSEAGYSIGAAAREVNARTGSTFSRSAVAGEGKRLGLTFDGRINLRPKPGGIKHVYVYRKKLEPPVVDTPPEHRKPGRLFARAYLW